MWTAIARHIAQSTGEAFVAEGQSTVGGGSINRTCVLSGSGRRYFVKLNTPDTLAMFEAEADGLEELHRAGAIRVPRPICSGVAADSAYLVIEWLPLGGRGDWEQLGEQLAHLHRTISSKGFGWRRDNTIGSTPQPNPWTAEWGIFFARHRIGHQLALARGSAIDRATAQELVDRIPNLLAGHRPEPSLLHGDLWSGNADFTAAEEPVLFDPATYYGDRETDLAMSELFGGFPESFYRGYRRAWPLAPGYERRKMLYNLYHVLNHYNLFGGGYASQANRMIRQLLQPID
ncbi:MAG: fructosamine kinase family protein [Aphanocapsa lilacina HA4352-LM1]|jgi:fructosamine-3-kinase|nr:fructosamine kinase family protein [Aphanocapsa lilacina HA4352-LM1]